MKFLTFPIKFIFCLPIYFYKFLISPILPHVCRFNPSCSNYFIKAIQEFGIFKGSFLGIKRLSKCTPRSKFSGFDPVPINIKGETKWLF